MFSVTSLAFAISYAWPSKPNPVTSVQACAEADCIAPDAPAAEVVIAAIAAALDLVEGRLDVGEIDGGGDHGEQAKEVQRAEEQHKTERGGDAEDDRPQLLGALVRGDEGIRPAAYGIDEREDFEAQGAHAEHQQDPGLDPRPPAGRRADCAGEPLFRHPDQADA